MAYGNQQPQRNDRFENYVPVAERIEQFYSRYPEGRINTIIMEHDRESGFVMIRAEVFRQPEESQPAATGHAYEVQTEGYVNKTSYIENCETGCVGRALAFLNFETKRGIASREEMEKVARMNAAQPRDTQPARAASPANKPAAVETPKVESDEAAAKLLDNRAKAIAAMPGTIERDEDRYVVTEPGIKGATLKQYRVWQHDDGVVMCSCEDYADHAEENPKYRCLHKRAVAHWAKKHEPEAPETVEATVEDVAPMETVADISRRLPIADPTARSMADLMTPKQEGMIKALAKEAHVDPDRECVEVLVCSLRDLSKKAASAFIDHLQKMAKPAGGSH